MMLVHSLDARRKCSSSFRGRRLRCAALSTHSGSAIGQIRLEDDAQMRRTVGYCNARPSLSATAGRPSAAIA